MSANVFDIPIEEPKVEVTPIAIARKQASPLTPRTMTEAIEFAKVVANSDFVPKDYRGKPGNILVAVQWGYELGLGPMQAMQNLAVINGKPSLYGDAMLAVVQASSVCEWVREEATEQGAVCTVKRKGDQEPHAATFTIEDAKKAGLWGKQGPWTQYPKRMLQMRARSFALRDKFSDVLRGLIAAEEAMDYPAEKPVQPEPVRVGPALSETQKAEAVAALREAISTSDTLEDLRDATRAALSFAKVHNDKALHEDFKSQSADLAAAFKEMDADLKTDIGQSETSA